MQTVHSRSIKPSNKIIIEKSSANGLCYDAGIPLHIDLTGLSLRIEPIQYTIYLYFMCLVIMITLARRKKVLKKRKAAFENFMSNFLISDYLKYFRNLKKFSKRKAFYDRIENELL